MTFEWITPEQEKKLEKRAEKMGIPVNELIERLLQKWLLLENNKTGEWT